MKRKNENLAQILGVKTGAVTILPHLQESRPEIPRIERERESGRNMMTPVSDKLLGFQLQSTPLTGSFLLLQGQLKK